jgi:hypothetical protein
MSHWNDLEIANVINYLQKETKIKIQIVNSNIEFILS